MSGIGSDWRNGRAYDYFDGLGPEKIAHEFLRRNEQYAADYATEVASPSDEPLSALARWGVRFRGGSEAPRRQGGDCLAPVGQFSAVYPRLAAAAALRWARPRRGATGNDRLGR